MGAVKSPLSSHTDNPWYGYMKKGYMWSSQENYSLDFNWDIDWSVMTVLAAHGTSYRYENRKNDQGSYSKEKTDNVEFRLNSPSGSTATWVTGLYFYNAKDKLISAKTSRTL